MQVHLSEKFENMDASNPSLQDTFSGVSPLEQTGLSVLVVFKIESLAKSKSEDFQVRMGIADGHSFGVAGGH